MVSPLSTVVESRGAVRRGRTVEEIVVWKPVEGRKRRGDRQDGMSLSLYLESFNSLGWRF
jgi:hypothetical protein